ncbi:beta-glucuronosyltransferase GlcAT14A isoform X2 [Cajanus cajan]|nr:beta-glucuronosyltransferase GlcAT14A isoform X2 [Cajanus cajan]
MSIKIFLVSFILTSLLFFLIFIPTRLTITIPNSTFKPSMSFFNTTNATNSYPVTFAYLISASKGDSGKLKRLMKALYHPGNYYLIHLDYGAPEAEHRDVVEYVAKDPVFGQLGNVWVVGKRNLVTYRGPTMISTTLHAMAMLLRTCQWDWFINLSASDYPLVTQDDMIQAFSHVPRHINFIHHSSQLGWKL